MKIKLTESQFNRLKTRLNETISGDKYSYRVKLDTSFYGEYNGREIVDISEVYATLTYDISIEAREWGIKGIYLGNIVGPSEVEYELTYAIDDDNTKEISVKIPFDWSKLETEEHTGSKNITVGDVVEVRLAQNEEGGISITSLEMPVYVM